MCIAIILIVKNQSFTQSYTYKPLYTSSTFAEALNTYKANGVIPGMASVGANGNASYNIEVDIPNGTNNRKPSLNINYSSSGGNGALGMGWSLGGLSMITRSPKNNWDNGIIRDINYHADEGDFAIDGKKLKVLSGFNNHEGVVYGTEDESFSRIIGHDDEFTNGLAWFEVILKDGTIMEYGRTGYDSRQVIHNDDVKPHVYIWLLNKITYPEGNFMIYKYAGKSFVETNNTNTVEPRIEKILYTNNKNANRKEDDFFAEIKFEYVDRIDKVTQYTFGAETRLHHLLHKITSSVADYNTPIENSITDADRHMYKTLIFEYGYRNGNSYLNEVTLQTRDGDYDKNQKTIFKYGDNTEIYYTNINAIAAGEDVDLRSGDFDSDGKSDLLALTKGVSDGFNFYQGFTARIPDKNGVWEQYKYTGFNQAFNKVECGKRLPNSQQLVPTDFNGDGYEDLLFQRTDFNDGVRNIQEISVHLNVGKHYEHKDYGGTFFSNRIKNSDHNRLATFEHPQSVALPHRRRIANDNRFASFHVGDFDGDGKTDIITITSNSNTTNTKSSDYHTSFGVEVNNNVAGANGGEFRQLSEPLGFGNVRLSQLDDTYVGDFNGDGKTDLMLKGGDEITICDINMDNLQAVRIINFKTNKANGDKDEMTFGDFNGDRKLDFIIKHADGTCFKYILGYKKIIQTALPILYDTPKQYINHSYHPTTLETFDNSIIVSDFNGDGKSDLFIQTIKKEGKDRILPNTFPKSGAITYTLKETLSKSIYFSNGDSFDDKVLIESNSTIHTKVKFETNSYGFKNYTIGDFNGDGAADLYNNGQYISFSQSRREQQLVEIKNNIGLKTSFEYKLINQDTTVYQRPGLPEFDFIGSLTLKTSTYNYPLSVVKNAMSVVKHHNESDGIGGISQKQFAYESAIVHRNGRGFLGFLKTTVINPGMKTYTETYNKIDTNYYVMLPVQVAVRKTQDSTVLTQTINAITEVKSYSQKRFNIFNKKTYSVNLVQDIVSVTEKEFDDHANMTHSVIKTFKTPGLQASVLAPVTILVPRDRFLGGFDWVTKIIRKGATIPEIEAHLLANPQQIETTNTTATYIAKVTTFPRLSDHTSVTKKRLDKPAYTLETNFEYTDIGQIKKKTDFANKTHPLVTEYKYDKFGNQDTLSVTPHGMSARSTYLYFDKDGRAVKSTKDRQGLITSFTNDFYTGTPLSETSPTNHTITYKYDNWNRLISTTSPLGDVATKKYSGYDISPYHHLRYIESDYKNDVLISEITFDGFNRALETESIGFNDESLYSHSSFNELGLLSSSTSLYKRFGGLLGIIGQKEKKRTTYNKYNDQQQLTESYNEIGAVKYAYNIGADVETTTTAPDGKITKKKVDPTGKLISSTDNGGTQYYDYDSQGNLLTVTFEDKVMSRSEYDEYGRQTSLTDINAGTTSYTYNVLGQLLTETYPKGETHTLIYDDLDRLTERIGPEGSTITKYYGLDAQLGSANKVQKVTGFQGNTEEFFYDSYGRVTKTISTIDNKIFENTIEYDRYGNVAKKTYPSGFALNYTYDKRNNLVRIKNTDNTKTLYETKGVNADGLVDAYILGNGKMSENEFRYGLPSFMKTDGVQNLHMTWDYRNSNLLERKDYLKNKTEKFLYDNLDRLTSTQINGGDAFITQYENGGNILNKTGVGSYVYHPNKINAVVGINNAPVGAFAPMQQDIHFTSYQRADRISHNGYELNYSYGADYERTKGILSQNGNTINTRYYLGDYELNIKPDGSSQELHYISSPAGLIAIVVKENNTENYNYIYTDHLGSIVAVTNEAGNVIAEQNFDAWGRQRNPNTWELMNPTATTTELGLPSWLYRGYTGHEMLREFALINMNARLYDPVVGRMISPDNLVTDATSTQGYNRYSYANNNPLKNIDPSGNDPITLSALAVAALIGAGTAAAAYTLTMLVQCGNLDGWDWGAFGKSVLQGAVAGIISCGIGSAFQTLTNNAVQCINGTEVLLAVDKIGLTIAQSVVHGISSGLQSMAWGGDFHTSALSGAFGSVAGSLAGNSGFVAHAVAGAVGGAFGSYITGGDPLQGALVGAIVSLTNHWLHKPAAQIIDEFNALFKPKEKAGEMLRAPVKTTKSVAKKQEAKAKGEVSGQIADAINKYTDPGADLAIGGAEYKLGRILADRGKYGSLHPETIIRTPIGNISAATKVFQTTGSILKGVGFGLGLVGMVGTVAQYQSGQIGGVEASLDLIMGGVGFIPSGGWIASGTYFLIAKPLYNHYIKQ